MSELPYLLPVPQISKLILSRTHHWLRTSIWACHLHQTWSSEQAAIGSTADPLHIIQPPSGADLPEVEEALISKAAYDSDDLTNGLQALSTIPVTNKYVQAAPGTRPPSSLEAQDNI
ncbi:hypothetical protein M9H77_20368 [Catharanthus roseus]|uniref:Uncharacterized protein n=1 Tax=Catharanthus roseus TaxID=4058 RepID=A0ACC0AJJ2_CATRO|nr:hypothetical protein M9H77_20368 [Catharanthus roseus]